MVNVNFDLTKFLSPNLWRKDEPSSIADLKYDNKFGFENVERPERKITATLEEMNSTHLDYHHRTQCAHLHIQLKGCLKYNPVIGWTKCNGLRKEIHHCYAEENVQDMKEFEREKRLNARERRIAEAQAREKK